jgi:hypothetical protein
MALSRLSSGGDSGGGSELMTPKNIAIAAVAVIVLLVMSVRLAFHFGILGGEPVITDPAVTDPTSQYTPEEKENVKKLQQKLIEEEAAKPTPPPPAGS